MIKEEDLGAVLGFSDEEKELQAKFRKEIGEVYGIYLNENSYKDCSEHHQSSSVLSTVGLADLGFLRRSGIAMSMGLLPLTDNWMEQYKLAEERKRGDCASIPGWDTRNCCESCHDPGRTDADLSSVNGKRICCHAERWVKGETWEYSR